MTAPKLVVKEFQLFERPVILRLPFRFGVVTLTEAREAIVRARVQLEFGAVLRIPTEPCCARGPPCGSSQIGSIRGFLHHAEGA